MIYGWWLKVCLSYRRWRQRILEYLTRLYAAETKGAPINFTGVQTATFVKLQKLKANQ